MTTEEEAVQVKVWTDSEHFAKEGVRAFQTLRSKNGPNFPPSRPGDGTKALVLA